MIVLGKKIVKIILYFLKTKKVFRAPKKAKILVYDGEALEILKPLFNGEAFEVFYTRKEYINISPSIIIRCVLYILRNKKFRFSLSMSFIQQVKPSIVLTFIDNSSTFHQLDANNKDDRIKFIAIQNGSRKLNGPIELVKKTSPDPKTIYHSNFFCFGEYDVDLYQKHGASVKNFYPCGSLIDSYSRSLTYDNTIKTSDIYLVVNDWSQAPYESPWGPFRRDYELLLNHLKKFQRRNGQTIVANYRNIIGSDEYEQEVKWFHEHLGTNVHYVDRNGKDFQSYSIADHAKVVVGMHSTLLREFFGRGNKVLECNYGDLHFDVLVEGMWQLKEKGYEIFEKRLLDLLVMGADDYKTLCGKYPSYFIGYDEAQPTHAVISSFIECHIHE